MIDKHSPNVTFSFAGGGGLTKRYTGGSSATMIASLAATIETADPDEWESAVDQMNAELPDYKEALSVLVTIVKPVCSAMISAILHKALASAFGDNTAISSIAGTSATALSSQRCSELIKVLSDFRAALEYQEEGFWGSTAAAAAPGFNSASANCSVFPHAKWHWLSAAVLGRSNQLVHSVVTAREAEALQTEATAVSPESSITTGAPSAALPEAPSSITVAPTEALTDPTATRLSQSSTLSVDARTTASTWHSPTLDPALHENPDDDGTKQSATNRLSLRIALIAVLSVVVICLLVAAMTSRKSRPSKDENVVDELDELLLARGTVADELDNIPVGVAYGAGCTMQADLHVTVVVGRSSCLRLSQSSREVA